MPSGDQDLWGISLDDSSLTKIWLEVDNQSQKHDQLPEGRFYDFELSTVIPILMGKLTNEDDGNDEYL